MAGLIIESFGPNKMTQASFKISLDSIGFGKPPNNGDLFFSIRFLCYITIYYLYMHGYRMSVGFTSVKEYID